MYVYDIRSTIKGLEASLYMSMSGAINCVHKAARNLGMFHKVAENSPEAVLVVVVNLEGDVYEIDGKPQEALIVRREVIKR